MPTRKQVEKWNGADQKTASKKRANKKVASKRDDADQKKHKQANKQARKQESKTRTKPTNKQAKYNQETAKRDKPIKETTRQWPTRGSGGRWSQNSTQTGQLVPARETQTQGAVRQLVRTQIHFEQLLYPCKQTATSQTDSPVIKPNIQQLPPG